MISPLMISNRDKELSGAGRYSDPLAMLPIWRSRARMVVPHLTEQTTNVRGFQILVEAYRLWAIYKERGCTKALARGIGPFFMLIEQAFARIVYSKTKDWPLLGARRLRSRGDDKPSISLDDHEWHLLGNQLGSGIWGSYRGAARRAKLLTENMTSLTDDARTVADSTSIFQGKVIDQIFGFIDRAVSGESIQLPTDGRNSLIQCLLKTFNDVPLKLFFWAKLIEDHSLNKAVAERLIKSEELNHRVFLIQAASEMSEHQSVLKSVIECENYLAALEGIFYRLCSKRGQTIHDVADDLPVDLQAFDSAKTAYLATKPKKSPLDQLDTTNLLQLVHSILDIHKEVCTRRGRSTWVWEEGRVLHCDIDIDDPSDDDCKVGLAWRNDYYLGSLRAITVQLKELNV